MPRVLSRKQSQAVSRTGSSLSVAQGTRSSLQPGDFWKYLKAQFPAYPLHRSVQGELADRFEEDLYSVITNRWDRNVHRQRFDLAAMPPDSVKSTVIAQGGPLFALGICPDLRILEFSEDMLAAKSNLAKIKSIMETDDYYLERFGAKRPKVRGEELKRQWADDAIICVDRKGHHREPSIGIQGFRNLSAGARWDVIIIDDPHARTSALLLDRVWKAICDLKWRMEEWSMMFSICTPWTEWDFFDRMRRLWQETLTHPALVRPGCANSEWQYANEGRVKSLLPELWSDEAMTKKFVECTDKYDWARMMELNPVPTADQKFLVDHWNEAEIPRADLDVCLMSIDPRASSSVNPGRGNSEDAIVVGGWTRRGTYHQADCESGFWGTDLRQQKIAQHVKDHRPDYFVIEKSGWESEFQRHCEITFQKLELEGYFVPVVVTVPHAGRAKDDRIRQWLYDYNSGLCTFSPSMKGREKFRANLFAFPGSTGVGDKDDLDAWAQLLRASVGMIPQFEGMPENAKEMNTSRVSIEMYADMVQERVRAAEYASVGGQDREDLWMDS